MVSARDSPLNFNPTLAIACPLEVSLGFRVELQVKWRFATSILQNPVDLRKHMSIQHINHWDTVIQ